MVAKKRAKSLKITKNTIILVIFAMFWVAFSLTASQFVFANLLHLLIGESLTKPFWVLIFYIISYLSTLALIFLALPRLYRRYQKTRQTKKTTTSDVNVFSTDRAELGLTGAPTFTDMGLAPIGFVVYAMMANVVTTIFSAFSWFDVEQYQDVGFAYFITTADRFFAVIAIVLIAPIAEEIIMRGWLYAKLREHAGIIAAIILTSLTFAILHGQWNVAVVTFSLSVVLCGLREITGTIWSGILLHMLVNGVAFYIRYVAQIV